jgi:predicted permease
VTEPLARAVLGDTRVAVLIFLGAAALLLLITCVNVGTLLLVRGLVRARDIAVRVALGASRGRIVWQLLLENALLAVGGGAIGLLVAIAGVRLFLAFAPTAVPRLDEVTVNGGALTSGIAITSMTMLLFGVIPAIVAARTDPATTLSGTRYSLRRSARLVARMLVGAQVALATMILAAAALLGASLLRMQTVNLGFDPSHLLIAEPSLRYDMYSDLSKQRAVLEQMIAAARAVPSVRAVAPVVAIPFSGTGGWDGPFSAEGDGPARPKPWLNMEVVTPAYFSVMGLRITRGRAFSDGDRPGAPAVVMLNESAAQALWAAGDVIGKKVVIGSRGEVATVVGVVPDTRYRELREPRASIYFPLAQNPFPYLPMTLAIRTAGPPTLAIPALRRALGESAPGVGLESADSFETLLGGPLALPRLNALLLAIFASAALLIAAVGLHGVVSAMVRQRTRELGIRLALGATGATLHALVMREVFAVVSVGAAAGLAGSLVLSHSLHSLVFEASPTDPTILGAILGVLLLAAMAGALAPAHRAARTDPARVLRME